VRLKDIAHAMVESTVGVLSQMMAPVSNTARSRAKEKAPPPVDAVEEKKAPAKKRAKKEDIPPAPAAPDPVSTTPPEPTPTPPKKKRNAKTPVAVPAPRTTTTTAEKPSLPPATASMATLDRMWQRKDGPPPFKFDERCYWMWSHMSANVLLWALRIGNKDQVLVRMMQEHADPICELHVTGELARRLPASLSDAFKGYPGGDKGVRYGQAGLATAYAFLHLFKLPKVKPLEETCIFLAEATHGRNDDVARTLLEYRLWCKQAPHEKWQWTETVAVARAAVEKHKATLAAQSKPSRSVPHAVVKMKKEATPFDDSNDEDGMDVDPPEPEPEQTPPPPPAPAELIVPALPATELPLADEFDPHKFCKIVFATQAPKLLKDDHDFMLRHADTLFSVREMPSKTAMMNVLRDWHTLQVNTRGRDPSGTHAVAAILEHSYAHFLLALCTIAEASRPTPVQTSTYAFNWTELKVYGGGRENGGEGGE
jgi:hypothetical protein